MRAWLLARWQYVAAALALVVGALWSLATLTPPKPRKRPDGPKTGETDDAARGLIDAPAHRAVNGLADTVDDITEELHRDDAAARIAAQLNRRKR